MARGEGAGARAGRRVERQATRAGGGEGDHEPGFQAVTLQAGILAFGFVLIIGDVSLFKRSNQLASYVGLILREHSSGGKQRLGSISKQGNRFLRQLLVEAAQTVHRLDEGFRKQYQARCHHQPKDVAKVAAAAKENSPQSSAGGRSSVRFAAGTRKAAATALQAASAPSHFAWILGSLGPSAIGMRRRFRLSEHIQRRSNLRLPTILKPQIRWYVSLQQCAALPTRRKSIAACINLLLLL
ncbi:MAG: IS110 family transposase [Terracidiphilus sp.]